MRCSFFTVTDTCCSLAASELTARAAPIRLGLPGVPGRLAAELAQGRARRRAGAGRLRRAAASGRPMDQVLPQAPSCTSKLLHWLQSGECIYMQNMDVCIFCIF